MTLLSILLGIIIGGIITINHNLCELCSKVDENNYLHRKIQKELEEDKRIIKEIKDNGPGCRN